MKTKLTIDDQIAHMKKKGITFSYDVSEEDAKYFLQHNNYYIKLASYRNNYNKQNDKYINLDFAYLKERHLSDDVKKSQITMANWDDIVTFDKSTNHDIAFIGYPLNDNGTDSATVDYGSLTLFEYNDSLRSPVGCLQLSANINPGNSGGPIFAMIENKVKVIGIVSKADNHAKLGIHWAVPITEVLTMHKQGDKVEQDSVTYRR